MPHQLQENSDIWSDAAQATFIVISQSSLSQGGKGLLAQEVAQLEHDAKQHALWVQLALTPRMNNDGTSLHNGREGVVKAAEPPSRKADTRNMLPKFTASWTSSKRARKRGA